MPSPLPSAPESWSQTPTTKVEGEKMKWFVEYVLNPIQGVLFVLWPGRGRKRMRRNTRDLRSRAS